ncbi:hypothetical protein BJ508DRAFT_310672 [Ascobolus immersus RN42]|uniref:F-box domain-containing protein n=1 Tax=Ascobolus immersus RN42 TaxID=1160509 RepID=A0A3N4HV28_ASCIM|nr:hypothetical protein BJ508DRAFT_310672 [Ascobolus immersus RN42]
MQSDSSLRRADPFIIFPIELCFEVLTAPNLSANDIVSAAQVSRKWRGSVKAFITSGKFKRKEGLFENWEVICAEARRDRSPDLEGVYSRQLDSWAHIDITESAYGSRADIASIVVRRPKEIPGLTIIAKLLGDGRTLDIQCIGTVPTGYPKRRRVDLAQVIMKSRENSVCLQPFCVRFLVDRNETYANPHTILAFNVMECSCYLRPGKSQYRDCMPCDCCPGSALIGHFNCESRKHTRAVLAMASPSFQFNLITGEVKWLWHPNTEATDGLTRANFPALEWASRLTIPLGSLSSLLAHQCLTGLGLQWHEIAIVKPLPLLDGRLSFVLDRLRVSFDINTEYIEFGLQYHIVDISQTVGSSAWRQYTGTIPFEHIGWYEALSDDIENDRFQIQLTFENHTDQLRPTYNSSSPNNFPCLDDNGSRDLPAPTKEITTVLSCRFCLVLNGLRHQQSQPAPGTNDWHWDDSDFPVEYEQIQGSMGYAYAPTVWTSDIVVTTTQSPAPGAFEAPVQVTEVQVLPRTLEVYPSVDLSALEPAGLSVPVFYFHQLFPARRLLLIDRFQSDGRDTYQVRYILHFRNNESAEETILAAQGGSHKKHTEYSSWSRTILEEGASISWAEKVPPELLPPARYPWLSQLVPAQEEHNTFEDETSLNWVPFADRILLFDP